MKHHLSFLVFHFNIFLKEGNYFNFSSSETVSFFLPLALLRAKTLRPLLLLIRSLKPCLFFLFRLEG